MATTTLRRDLETLKLAVRGRSPRARATLAALRADRGHALTLAGFDHEPRQAALLRSTAPRMLIGACRQWGKSVTAALMAVVEALIVPRALVLLLAPVQRQSGELFAKVTGIYDALGRPVPEQRRTQTTLELLNGSRVIALPGVASTVRGFSSVRLLVVDEAAFARDELFAAVSPMLSRSRGRLLMLSSAFARRGFFFESWENGGDDWFRTKVTAADVPALSPEFLAAERRVLGPRLYAMEYEFQFSDVLASAFDPDAIERALEAGKGIRSLFSTEAAA
jgi:hypothetical protein